MTNWIFENATQDAARSDRVDGLPERCSSALVGAHGWAIHTQQNIERMADAWYSVHGRPAV
ncbi:MAG TPA: hypothetical protein PLP85_02755 [Alcaligenes sp.]|nr:hypothetical protein [Alcaligenes sp.]